MVRTRDLVLIVLTLVMLFIAISATVGTRLLQQDRSAAFVPASPQALGVETATPPTLDRAGMISHLREKIAEGDVIEATPSVEVDVFAPTTSAVTLACAAPDTGIAIARGWPLSDVTLSLQGSARVVTHAPQPGVTASSTAAAVPAVRTLLTLPAVPQRTAEPQCLDSEIIGVTVAGSLMFNTDAVLYRTTPPGTLIGYARDGFPIYSADGGVRDECGGYESTTGYRYIVSASESTFMSCFVGTPQSFSF